MIHGLQVYLPSAARTMISCVSVTCGVQTVNVSPDSGADSTKFISTLFSNVVRCNLTSGSSQRKV